MAGLVLAPDTRVVGDLVGDRFLCETADRWLDIVTGAAVQVVLHDRNDGWEELTRRCEAEATEAWSALVDFGRVGLSRWFEARSPVAPTCDRPLSQAEDGRVRSFVDRVMRAADIHEGSGLQRVRAGPLEPRLIPYALSRAARALRAAGFVSVGTGVSLPRMIRPRLLHRHVALFSAGGDRDDGEALEWARTLAAASPRAHLIVTASHRLPSTTFRPRGPSRASVLATVDARIAAGRFDAADAALSAVSLDDQRAGRAECHDVGVRWAALRFWQGRFEEAAGIAGGGAGATERLVWRAMIAWACADVVVLRASVAALHGAACSPESVEACWAGILDLWLCDGRPAGRHVGLAIAGFARRAPADLGSLGSLQQGLAAEAFLWTGHVAAARRITRGPDAQASSSALQRALLDWIDAKCGGAGASEAERRALAFVRRTGARGICRWGMGRGVMNLLQGVSTLLQLVHDAEDEHAALKRGCSWVREHGGADAVGIVAHPGTALVISDGLGRADLETTDMREVFENGGRTVAEGPHAIVAAPMRYGGVTIGFAVVRGRREAASTLAEASGALASACAPALRARLDALALSGTGRALASEILGTSPAMTGLREAIARAAGTTFPVLVEGESGTGKELVARALHRLSPRRDRRFCAVNCAALTDELVEAELFGHARGAFTGAIGLRLGLFEEAHLGTLFLDEVSDLSPRAQAKLLRVLQEREIRRLGENAARPIDVRIVAATNQPLASVVGRGGFRQDLLFRLAVVRIRVPPLRDRIEDVPLLAHTFWKRLIADIEKHVQLGSDAIAALCRHRWPGNIRELQNVIAALAVAAPTRGRVGARHVGLILAEGAGRDGAAAETLDQARQACERRMIAAALARYAGRRVMAARELGLSRQGLAKAIRRLGLDARREPARLAPDEEPARLPAAASE